MREKRLTDAAADFQRALAHGADPARGHFHLALVCLAQADRNGAIAHLERVRTVDPSHAEAARLLKKLHDQR